MVTPGPGTLHTQTESEIGQCETMEVTPGTLHISHYTPHLTKHTTPHNSHYTRPHSTSHTTPRHTPHLTKHTTSHISHCATLHTLHISHYCKVNKVIIQHSASVEAVQRQTRVSSAAQSVGCADCRLCVQLVTRCRCAHMCRTCSLEWWDYDHICC